MILRIVQIISEWQKLPEPFIEFRPLKQMSEKEQAELEKIQADKDKAVADTYKAYYDMGVLEPYQIQFLQFGDSLDKIPVPEEDELPPVETLPEGEDAAKGQEDPAKEADGEDAPDEPGDNPDDNEGTLDKPEDIETRIAELEEKEELTGEEEKELEELKKQLEGEKTKGKK